MEFIILLISIAIKSLLLNTSSSTDFDVHKNWMDITTSTHIKNWYYDTRSVWTLDYPPLFAYLEYILGSLAYFIDNILHTNIISLVENNRSLLIYQRLSVIILGDLMLYLSLKRLKKLTENRFFIFYNILIFGGLILIDNIHFQYNGFLYGLFILSISYMLDKSYIKSSFIFSILLNFKHIFLYFAPAYFCFLLRNYILETKNNRLKRFMTISMSVVSTFLISFIPFIYYSDSNFSLLKQIFRRLFPIERGLVHSYWAPNFWAIYSFIDKVLFFIYNKYLDKQLLSFNKTALGLVSISEFNILPNISIMTCNVIVILLLTIFLVRYLFLQKISETPQVDFLMCLYISSFVFFFFGYHVHEKAILGFGIITVLLSSLIKSNDNKLLEYLKEIDFICLIVQIPLINDKNDYITKVVFVLFYFIIKNFKKAKLILLLVFYLSLDFITIQLIPYLKNQDENSLTKSMSLIIKYEFLPLMLISVLNSLHFAYNSYIIYFKTSNECKDKLKTN